MSMWQMELFGPRVEAMPPRDAAPSLHTASEPARTGDDENASMRLCVLGSGSGGNASVLHLGAQAILIDIGFGPYTLRKRLAQANVALEQVAAVCVTHLDRDHFRPNWLKLMRQWSIPLYVHRWHWPDLVKLEDAAAMEEADLLRVFEEQPFEPLPGLLASPLRMQHDVKGTIAFRFDWARCRLGYATDLGHAPPSLIDHFAGVDVLAIESNYDPMMQMSSTRPFFVKRRNMSQAGHLSNEQAFEAVSQIAARSPRGRPHHVVLLHRSSQCNHPGKIRRAFEASPELAQRVVLTQQRRRSRWITVQPAPAMQQEQLRLR